GHRLANAGLCAGGRPALPDGADYSRRRPGDRAGRQQRTLAAVAARAGAAAETHALVVCHLNPDSLMSQTSTPPADRTLVGRLLAEMDRFPGLGRGRSHIAFLALFFLGSLSLYLVVLKVRGPAAAIKTLTGLDGIFAFTPWWIWIY